MKAFPFISILIILSGCTDDTPDSPEIQCIENALNRYEMRPYKGEDVSNCWLDYLVQYKWNDEFYFDWTNECIDVILSPTNCNGDFAVDIYPDSILNRFFDELEWIKIVGVR